MEFNDIQLKFWLDILKLIEDFRKGEISYEDLVFGLEGCLDMGEYKNEALIYQWYDYWTPLEILSATKGNNATLEEGDKYISNMEAFLKSFL